LCILGNSCLIVMPEFLANKWPLQKTSLVDFAFMNFDISYCSNEDNG